MRITSLHRRRRGAVLPLVAICMIALLGMVALAIDIGMIAISRNQCQNSADAGALAGARTVTGDSASNFNFDAIASAAVQATLDNKVMAVNLQGDSKTDWNTTDPVLKAQVRPAEHTFVTQQVQVDVGSYTYTYDDKNSANESFKLYFPRKDTTEPYGAVKTTVTFNHSYSFAKIFGLSTYDTGATATAVHRPRDVVIIMDLSGSMRFQSLPANEYRSNQERKKSMNPETVYPEYGHYSDKTGADLYGNTPYASGSGEYYDPSNISIKSNAGPAILEYFFKNNAGQQPDPKTNAAFTRAPDSYNITPGGDNALKKTQDTGTDYAKTVAEVVVNPIGDQAFEDNGYDAYRSGANAFKCYTEGPGYWGKTFFIWPPDPRGTTLDPNNSSNHADNGAKDWRQRFFFKAETSGNLGWLDHNTVFFASSGRQRDPGSTISVEEGKVTKNYTYRPNYAAICKWLFADAPSTIFPKQLRAGRIKFYDGFPDHNDTTLNDRWWKTDAANLTNTNERFWKGYIEFVLNLRETGNGTGGVTVNGSVGNDAHIGNGRPFTWGSVQIKQKPDMYMQGKVNSGGYTNYNASTSWVKLDTLTGDASIKSPSVNDYVQLGTTRYRITAVQNYSSSTAKVEVKLNTSSFTATGGTTVKFYTMTPGYMDYADSPQRPKHHYWFGPMTMYDYLGNYNQARFWLPGSIPEAQAWACKVGIQTAIDDIKKNHPNDFVGLTFFSDPKYSQSDSGQHNRAVVPLGREYQKLKDSLWFPPSTVTGTATEITPWDPDFANVPRAKGGTAPGMGFMIAFNLLSSSTKNLRGYTQPQPQYKGFAGGLGRKGSARLIIFETDGAPNTRAFATIVKDGTDSYYPIRIKDQENLSSTSNTEWPKGSGDSFVDTEVYNTIVKQIVADETANPAGYSTKRKPALVYAIGYGTLFDPKNSSDPDQADAITFFKNIQNNGNVPTTTFPAEQLIYGTQEERIARMQAAIQTIMQGGVQVSLLE